MEIMVRTNDAQWIQANAIRIHDGAAVVQVPADAVTTSKFAGRDMVSFDIRRVAAKIPADYPNPNVMTPARFVLAR